VTAVSKVMPWLRLLVALLISTTDIIVKIPEIDKYFKHVNKNSEVRKISRIYMYPVGVNISRLK
jgi:hypothetical protein